MSNGGYIYKHTYSDDDDNDDYAFFAPFKN